MFIVTVTEEEDEISTHRTAAVDERAFPISLFQELKLLQPLLLD